MPTLKTFLTVIILTSVGVLYGCGGPQITEKDIKSVSAAEVRSLRSDPKNKVLLVDPRSERAFAEGHIPGAQNITLDAVDLRTQRIDPRLVGYNQIIVYGNDPGDGPARAMTKRLLAVSSTDTRMFVGGLSEWARLGWPIERLTPAE